MLDCIVIGAGPGGLVCTKELMEQGLREVVCLEQASDVGGVFVNAYDNLVLTSSATMSMFSDFWIGDGKQHAFWTKKEAVEYWKRYAKHFGVFERIRFNSKVVNVVPQEGKGVMVQLASRETLHSRRVALAIGNNVIANYPVWKDLLTDVEYLHSKEYRNAQSMSGKNVLAVGGGESGSDIALEVSRVANKCWVSLRNTTGWIVPRRRGIYASDISTHRGVWGLPRDYGATLSNLIYKAELSQKDPVHNTIVELNKKIKANRGIWGIFGTKNLSLPKAIVHHGCKVVGEIVKVEDGGKTLHTAWGETLRNIDAVIFSTGYKNYVSFLPEELKETDPRSLYKHMFHPKYRDKIVWIGWARPGFGSQFPIMEMQARFFALICKGERTLPDPAEMERVTSLDRAVYLEQFQHNAHRVRSLVDYHCYMDDIASLIGCQPPLWKYFFSHPRIWLTMVYGATQATQFRLQGPGKKESLAQEILMKLPLSRFNHMVKAGLKGRVIYTFKALVPKFGFAGFTGF
ncbi:NAD(P)-binding domain-containing protein [Moorena producens JHB]|uniref:NAD(P)-binding domain-containing protein n=1 Tax=Moorena producens (strain JHB) TaxID=1454205 RepID=A0A1D9FZY9_MOOP1|nr:NAD(P)-binding domain-containing protein [Moorena producens]AOY80926.1 NAD(P)-binding domain-containing protein [Moorena producens JHB]